MITFHFLKHAFACATLALVPALNCPSASAQTKSEAAPTNLQLLDQALAQSGRSNRVFVGDMIFPRATFVSYRNGVAGSENRITRSALYNAPRWPGGRVAYSFDANLPAAQRTAFEEACREWESKANLHFVARTSEANFIHVYQDASGGSYSFVGEVGGSQDMSLASWATKWTACHEIAHALGAMHEQCRSDRDSFVTINFANIAAGSEGNFAIVADSINKEGYDFDSVMHYPNNAFAVDPNAYTITCKPDYANFQGAMGQRTHLSTKDIAGMVSIYGAPGTASTFSIAGLVSLGNGPLSGATLSLNTGKRTTSGSTGAFSLAALPAGTYTLTPSKTGYSFSPTSRSIPLSGNLSNANFVATPIVPVTVPTLSISSVAMVEGNAGAPYLTFNVSLSEPSKQTVTVNFATANGTATSGSDYTARTGTLSFRAGSTTADVRVSVLPDRIVEASETFSVVLSSPVGATLGTATGKGTLLNDDRARDAQEAPNDASSPTG